MKAGNGTLEELVARFTHLLDVILSLEKSGKNCFGLLVSKKKINLS